MIVDPAEYAPLGDNPHDLAAGALLFPTDAPIVAGGGTSREFVREQGGDEETFVFLLGARTVRPLIGPPVEIVEGVFLTAAGRGFHPTWDFGQLTRETALGGWRVIPAAEVLERWTDEVERRMNA